MRPHIHSDIVSLVVTTAGVLVIIHVMRLAAIQLSKANEGAGKALAAFALAD